MKSFKIYNIKSFEETPDIELKRINIFVGKNSSGKSSLIRFPVILSQTFAEDVYTPLLFFGNLIDYGNFDDVIFNHKEDGRIKLSFKFEPKNLRNYLARYYRIYREEKMDFEIFTQRIKAIGAEVSIIKNKRNMIVERFGLLINEQVAATVERDEKGKYELLINFDYKNFQITDETIHIKSDVTFNKFIPEISFNNDTSFSILKNFVKSKEIDTKLVEKATLLLRREMAILFNEEETEINSQTDLLSEFASVAKTLRFISYLFKAIYTDLSNFSNQITYIGPFRKDPERIYRDSENSFKDVGKNGENASMLLRRAQQSRSELLNKVSSWFWKSMGVKLGIEEIENSNLFKLMVYNEDKSNGNNIIDVGYGIAQVLPIVTQIYFSHHQDQEVKRSPYRLTSKKTFIIEQPELHLHPAAQANLADLFVEKVCSDKQSTFLIETHSEHLIRRLQVLIADKEIDLSYKDIAIYYVDKENGPASSVKNIRLNANGQFIDKWPSGFFDKGYELSRQLLRVVRESEHIED